MAPPLVTFTSDFGTRDYYVGAVKGAILSVFPEARIVDISYEVPSHDVLAGAFCLAGFYSTFPAGTIHLVVVDPGVGSSRRGILVSNEKYRFVAPDNGVLSLVYDRESVSRVHSLEAEHYYRKPVSPTFHGRDIFAPVVGWLLKGIDESKFGPEISDYRKLAIPPVQRREGGVLEGFILHIDKFGNLVTNFTPEAVGGLELSSGRFELGDQVVRKQVGCYADAGDDEPVFLVGSSGYIEIAVQKQSAAKVLNARRGMKVTLAV